MSTISPLGASIHVSPRNDAGNDSAAWKDIGPARHRGIARSAFGVSGARTRVPSAFSLHRPFSLHHLRQ